MRVAAARAQNGTAEKWLVHLARVDEAIKAKEPPPAPEPEPPGDAPDQDPANGAETAGAADPGAP